MEFYIGPVIAGVGFVLLIAVFFMRKKKKEKTKQKEMTRQEHIDSMQKMKSH